MHLIRSVLLVSWVCCCDFVLAAELDVGSGYAYSTIGAALAAAGDNDIVTVHSGTYTEGQLNITQEGLLLRGAVGEARPKLVSTSGQYANMVVINANNITVRGFEMTHQSGDQYGYGVGDGNAAAAHTGWVVEDCVIHDTRSAIWNRKAGTRFVFRDNEVYNNYSKRLYLEATESFVCEGNFFHSATRSGQDVIQWYTGNDEAASGDTRIAYNYINGGGHQIQINGQSSGTPSGSRTLTIEHNTLDGNMGQFNESGDYASQLLTLWDNASHTYDSDKIVVRDNLFVEALWYGLRSGDGTTGGLDGDLLIENSIFYNNYSNDSWYPTFAYPEEWPVPRGEAGWTSVGGDFLFISSWVADPLLARFGTSAEEYYALLPGSPAYGTATDGTNIGAYQGIVPGEVPEPSSIALIIFAGSGILFRRRFALWPVQH